MTPDRLFSICGALAGVGWLILLLGPVWPKRLRDHYPRLVAAICIPVLISLAYAAVIIPHWPGHRGGFNSLDQVALLFSDRWLLLAGWVHYLAFDLFVGGWEFADSRQRRVPHLAIVPALILTFLFGPAGFLVYLGTRSVFGRSLEPAGGVVTDKSN
jgi:hypothetical protein